jgi:predicted HTH domain antitoxin
VQQTFTPTWPLRQLIKLQQRNPELVEAAVKDILEGHPDLRWSLVVSAYLDGDINLGKAAELLRMHRLQLEARFRELGIPLRLGPATLEEAEAEVAALEEWNRAARQDDAS